MKLVHVLLNSFLNRYYCFYCVFHTYHTIHKYTEMFWQVKMSILPIWELSTDWPKLTSLSKNIPLVKFKFLLWYILSMIIYCVTDHDSRSSVRACSTHGPTARGGLVYCKARLWQKWGDNRLQCITRSVRFYGVDVL